MSYKNEFSTYRIAYTLSKLHLWNALLKLYFLFSVIAHRKKAHVIALSVNGILVTRNQRDFIKVPNLVIEDWSTIVSG